MRPRGWVALALVGLGACSLLTTFDEEMLTEDTYQRCRDRVDNDSDGLVDCDDPPCASFGCRELAADDCADGADNDGDKLADCQDPGCAALPGVCVEKTAQACADGRDNDTDGLTDCKDPDCSTQEACQEIGAAECANQEDDDRDGLVDCNDFDCQKQARCCTLKASAFVGDSFKHNGDCSLHVCTAHEPTCCESGYEMCSPFDPSTWVAWGLPRARQEQGAFVANEPCGCEASGIVSAEKVSLSPGTQISFNLGLGGAQPGETSICAGLTRSAGFADDLKQCAGSVQPNLLVGICLEAPKGARPRLSAVVDGVVQQTRPSSVGGEAIAAKIAVQSNGVQLSAGPLSYRTTPLASHLTHAMFLAYGTGTTARMDSLVVKEVRATTGRCRAPSAWYRHLARGEPVIPATATLLEASQPSVIQQPSSGTYLMLFAGKGDGSSTRSGLYSATSRDGLTWTVSDDAVIPSASGDTSFGISQSAPSLLHHKGLYHVWYSREDTVGGGTQLAIAHATSTDGLTWKAGTGPTGQAYVLEPDRIPAWDSMFVWSPSVVVGPDGRLLMWYTGSQRETGGRSAIGLARSSDGVSWERLQAQPVIAPENGTPDLACEDPAVVYDSSRKLYLIWYTHRAFGHAPALHHAASPNGLGWARWSTGDVLSAGPLGTFDERGVLSPTVLLQQDRIRLWYSGTNGKSASQIGYAENRGE